MENDKNTPMVAIPTDLFDFERYTWYATPKTYVNAVTQSAGITPLLIPSMGDQFDLDPLLDMVHGVLLTGSKTNVYPPLYGQAPTKGREPYDQERDSTAIPIIQKAIKKGIPILAICRGMQELNVALGGTLKASKSQSEAIDHRAPNREHQNERFAIRHGVTLRPNTVLSRILGTNRIQVNSLHGQAIDQLAEGLQIDAVAEDGIIEAVSMTGINRFVVGMQWHPEYWVSTDAVSEKIFRAFGTATRGYKKLGLKL